MGQNFDDDNGFSNNNREKTQTISWWLGLLLRKIYTQMYWKWFNLGNLLPYQLLSHWIFHVAMVILHLIRAVHCRHHHHSRLHASMRLYLWGDGLKQVKCNVLQSVPRLVLPKRSKKPAGFLESQWNYYNERRTAIALWFDTYLRIKRKPGTLLCHICFVCYFIHETVLLALVCQWFQL